MENQVKNRIELHVHVDGAVRASTIWELSKQKGLPLPGDGSLETLEAELHVTEPCKSLSDFLSKFKWISPAIFGDLKAVERIAYELCEDKAKNGVIYLEMRGSPHLLVPENGSITARDVIRSYLLGIQNGEKDFGITARFIICCMRNLPETALDVVDMCDEFRNEGVVGIDLAGDEAKDVDSHGEEHFRKEFITAFQAARSRGIHRTVHAGEDGPANGVLKALDLLAAERIGHGYHVLQDETIYTKIRESGIHLETCPYSSILTGAVKPDFKKHPIATFFDDNVNISINTDDPTITNRTLTDEYALLHQWGITTADIKKANINAAKASFIPEEDKLQLIDQIITVAL